MLTYLFVILATLVSVIVVVALYGLATKPDTFVYQRSTTIAAPAATIFPFIDDFHRWTEWSPYEHLDPAMKRTYGGSPRGKGATYGWTSEGKAGVGSMEITESTPSSRVVLALEFTKPFKASNVAEFTLAPENDGTTRVTWSMRGKNMPITKVMLVFMDLDAMIGRDFEVGLSTLKAKAETAGSAPHPTGG